MNRGGGVFLLLFAAACGDGTFFEQPWPRSHSAVAVWSSLDDRNQRLAQAGAGEPLELELPQEEGRLYVRSYAPQLSIAGQSVSDCPASLTEEGTPFPPASTHWTTEASRGKPEELRAEDDSPRAFEFRAPSCAVKVEDPCEGLTREELPVPPGVLPLSISRIDDDSFYLAGTNTAPANRVGRLFRYDGGSYQEIAHQSAAASFTRVRSFSEGKLVTFSIPPHDAELITESGSVTPYGTTLGLSVAGASDRVYGYTTNRIAELFDDGSSVELPAPPETLEGAAAFGAGQLAVLGSRDIFVLRNNSWVSTSPPLSLAMSHTIAGGPYRLYQVGGTEALLILEPDGTWVDETSPGDGTGRFRTATDVSARTVVAAGNRIMALRGRTGWCVHVDIRYAYLDSVAMSEGSAILVSASLEGAEPLITRVRDR